MPRDLSGAMSAAIAATVVRPVVLCTLELDSGTVRLSSADRNLVIDGETYYGCGRLAGVSGLESGAQLQASAVKLSLSGIQTEFVAKLLAENYQGATARLSLGLFSEDWTIIRDPVLLFRGQCDQVSLQFGDTAVIALTAQNELARWETPRVRRYTDADQQQAHPGDTSMRWVSAAAEREIYWGASPQTQLSAQQGGAPSAIVIWHASGAIEIEGGTGGSRGSY